MARARRYDAQNRALVEVISIPGGTEKWAWLEDEIVFMARDMRIEFSPLGRTRRQVQEQDPEAMLALQEAARREQKRRDKQEKELGRRLEAMERMREEQRRRQVVREAARREREKAGRAKATAEVVVQRAPPSLPCPAVPLSFDLPAVELQETMLPLADLRGYFLRERAACWWVSNQSDDLLCWPYCCLQRFEYQIRSALRVLGPLRGRALLSDEVGLGKTIEAGLVLKEYLTRAMVKRFLVLTLPSLVDQWEEELSNRFGLAPVTTNHDPFRRDPSEFWRQNAGVIASLHILKQPAHREIAAQVHW